MTLDEFMEHNTRLRHAIQTGIEMERQWDPHVTDGKHLRVGLNANMVELAAVVKLLIDKGLITQDEYFDYSINFMEREVASYEARLKEYFGGLDVRLL